MPRRALLLGVAVIGAAMTFMPSTSRMIGVGTGNAEAAQYYTRKRVNGRWVTGRFPKIGGTRASSRQKLARRGRYASLAVTPPARAEPATASPAVAAKGAAPSAAVATTASLAQPIPQAGLERMRPALEARARSLASTAGTIVVPLPESPPPTALSARSVTFDLQTGVKTVIFGDGAALTEPFDTSKVSDLISVRPGTR